MFKTKNTQITMMSSFAGFRHALDFFQPSYGLGPHFPKGIPRVTPSLLLSLLPPPPLPPLPPCWPLLALCGLIGLLALRLAPPAQFTLVTQHHFILFCTYGPGDTGGLRGGGQ